MTNAYFSQYKIQATHDKGKTTFLVIALTEDSAIEQVMKAENCPRCALTVLSSFKTRHEGSKITYIFN